MLTSLCRDWIVRVLPKLLFWAFVLVGLNLAIGLGVAVESLLHGRDLRALISVVRMVLLSGAVTALYLAVRELRKDFQVVQDHSRFLRVQLAKRLERPRRLDS